MLPHNHFLIAGLAIAPVSLALFPEKSIGETAEWVVIGGVVSAAIDLDIVTLVWLKSRQEQRLKPFRSLFEIYRRFKLFMDTITDTGVLKAGMITHFVVSVVAILVCRLLAPAYFVPVSIAVLSHILSDIPNMRRLSS